MQRIQNTRSYLSNAEKLGGVVQAPVTKLVAQHGNNLFRLALLEQSVVDDNVLLPRQTVKVRVAVGTALAAIDNMQIREWELELLGEVLNASLDSTRLQRRQLVKQRQNRNGVDGDREDLQADRKEPEVVEERVAGGVDDFEKSADDRSSKNNTQHLALQHVRHPKLEGLLIETELLLEHKGAIVRGGQREDGAEDVETEDEYQSLSDLALEPTGEVPRQQQAADAPELGEEIAIDEREVLDLSVETGNEVELGFCATVCLYRLTPHEHSV